MKNYLLVSYFFVVAILTSQTTFAFRFEDLFSPEDEYVNICEKKEKIEISKSELIEEINKAIQGSECNASYQNNVLENSITITKKTLDASGLTQSFVGKINLDTDISAIKCYSQSNRDENSSGQRSYEILYVDNLDIDKARAFFKLDVMFNLPNPQGTRQTARHLKIISQRVGKYYYPDNTFLTNANGWIEGGDYNGYNFGHLSFPYDIMCWSQK